MESSLTWYAMQATYKRNLELSEFLQGLGVDFYIPQKAVAPDKNNMSRDALLLFIRISEAEIQRLVNSVEYLRHQFVYEDNKRKPMTLSERDMKHFVKANKAQYRAAQKALISAAKAARVAGVA
ncbi:MAG: transcription termination/antitermination NusG family protein [Rikenellaceae bacterium]